VSIIEQVFSSRPNRRKCTSNYVIYVTLIIPYSFFECHPGLHTLNYRYN